MIVFDAVWFVKDKLHYNYFLELCSLIFLVAITIAYFSRKKFPVAIFKLFGVCLLVLSANVFLDVMSCVFLDHSDKVPIVVCEIITNLYYVSQVLASYLLFAYVFYSVGKSLKYSPLYLLTILPSAIAVLLVLTNPIHHWIFELTSTASGVYDFNHGPLFFALYVATGSNLFASALYTVVFRKKLSQRLIMVLFSIICLVLTCNIIQAIQQAYILSGVSYTLSMIFAIVSVNNPDDKVDRISNAFNNDAFIDYINNQRQERQSKYYIIFDIESFGMFTEAFGNIVANTLLSEIRRFIETVNKKTYIFKTQESRFVLLNKTKDEQNEMLEAIKNRFTLPFHIKNKSLNVTVNLFYFKNNGTFKNSDSYNDFINRTITTLNFRDSHYVELDDKFMKRINRDRKIKEVLERCLQNKEGLYMVYQPIYDLAGSSFNHFEALIRLDNKELGYIGPGEFIPIAESFGLANEIDLFVLEETCAFLERNPGINLLEVNVSCAEFFNNPSEIFLKIINNHKVDPKRICFEITETIAEKYQNKTREFMNDLGKYGVKFAMDDFGSGYSNVARFISLPFNIAKLDKTLLSQESNVCIFLDSAVKLFKNLNIPIVIEGVENKEQLEYARSKAIDFIQGYYFTEPLKEEDLFEFLDKKSNA